jgi:hypothetical protein
VVRARWAERWPGRGGPGGGSCVLRKVAGGAGPWADTGAWCGGCVSRSGEVASWSMRTGACAGGRCARREQGSSRGLAVARGSGASWRLAVVSEELGRGCAKRCAWWLASEPSRNQGQAVSMAGRSGTRRARCGRELAWCGRPAGLEAEWCWCEAVGLGVERRRDAGWRGVGRYGTHGAAG